MQDFRLQAPRLILRRFGEADLAAFMAYRNDPDVARYQGWEGITEPEARDFIREQQAIDPGVPGQWFQIAVERRDTGMLLGDCALRVDAEQPRQAELGYTLARPHQGYGFATEAVHCVLDYAFTTLKLRRIFAITDVRNAASVALLERLKWRREGHFIRHAWFKGEWVDEYLYALLGEEWPRD